MTCAYLAFAHPALYIVTAFMNAAAISTKVESSAHHSLRHLPTPSSPRLAPPLLIIRGRAGNSRAGMRELA